MCSKRNLRRKMCSHKRAFSDERQADEAAQRQAQINSRHELRLLQRGGEDSNLRAYLCSFCGRWHVGHTLSIPVAPKRR